MSRFKKSLHNFLSQSLLSKVTILAGFLATPLLLDLLGEETFGAYRVLIQWFSYLAIFEVVLNGTTIGRISLFVGEGKYLEVKKLLKASIDVGCKYLFVPLLFGALWIYFLPALIKTEAISSGELRWAGGALLISLFLGPLTGFRALIDCQQKSYLLTIINTTRGLLLILGGLGAAYFGAGLLQLAIVEVVVQVFGVLAVCYIGMRALPNVFKEKATKEDKESIESLNKPVFVSALTAHIGLVGDNLIIAWILGAKAATPFLLMQRLGQMAHSQLLAIGNATWAGLVELRAQKKYKRLEERFLEINELIGGLTLICIAPLLVYNEKFMMLWLGEGQYIGHAINLFIFLNLWLSSVSSFWGWLIGGIGLQKEWQPFTLWGTGINIVVSLVGCYFIGYFGPLLGTFIEFLFVRGPGQLILLRKHYHLSLRKILLINGKAFFIGALFTLTLWFVPEALRQEVDTWLSLVLHLSISLLIGLILFWFLLLSGESKKLWEQRVKRIFKKR